MKNKFNSVAARVSCGLLAGMLAPGHACGCACGCGVFDVATSSMLPTGQGGMAFVQYAYQDQDHNWSGSSQAPAANNDDKEIRTHFITMGLQYMFDRSWGLQAEVPYDFRYFKTTSDAGSLVSANWSQLGDIRIEGIYTGLFPDMSAGITFGAKLPTGSYSYEPDIVDRDSQLGSGSTDFLLGGFYRNSLSPDNQWNWFAQFELDVPVLTQVQYRPGVEVDSAAGIVYEGLSLGPVKISPLGQLIFSERTSDSGANAANPVASGYQRLMISPAIEFHIHPVIVYADAEIPVYQNFTGNQLVAPVLLKVSVSYMF
jgi:hypothetical protein